MQTFYDIENNGRQKTLAWVISKAAMEREYGLPKENA